MDEIIGFFTMNETTLKDGYFGTILTTNIEGFPEEFKYTNPIKPTKLQRIFYGELLMPYISMGLCGTPLFKTLKKQPNLVVINDISMLSLCRQILCPVVFVANEADYQETKTVLPLQSIKIDNVSSSTGIPLAPFYIIIHSDFKDNLKTIEDTFKRLYSFFNPFEVFARIGNTLQEISGENVNKE